MIEVKDLKKVFKLKRSEFKKGSDEINAVDGISFRIEKAKTLSEE